MSGPETLTTSLLSAANALGSSEAAIRRESLRKIVSVMGSVESASDTEICSLCIFLLQRLSDWASVGPACEALCLLVEKFPEQISSLPQSNDPFSSLDSELALVLGLDGEVPETKFLVHLVVKVLLKEVHAPSFAQSVRSAVLGLLQSLTGTNFQAVWTADWDEVLAQGIFLQTEDERDPRCLSISFTLIERIFRKCQLSVRTRTLLSESLAAYFPIRLKERDGDPVGTVSIADLKKKLNSAIISAGLVDEGVSALRNESAEDGAQLLMEFCLIDYKKLELALPEIFAIIVSKINHEIIPEWMGRLAASLWAAFPSDEKIHSASEIDLFSAEGFWNEEGMGWWFSRTERVALLRGTLRWLSEEEISRFFHYACNNKREVGILISGLPRDFYFSKDLAEKILSVVCEDPKWVEVAEKLAKSVEGAVLLEISTRATLGGDECASLRLEILRSDKAGEVLHLWDDKKFPGFPESACPPQGCCGGSCKVISPKQEMVSLEFARVICGKSSAWDEGLGRFERIPVKEIIMEFKNRPNGSESMAKILADNFSISSLPPEAVEYISFLIEKVEKEEISRKIIDAVLSGVADVGLLSGLGEIGFKNAKISDREWLQLVSRVCRGNGKSVLHVFKNIPIELIENSETVASVAASEDPVWSLAAAGIFSRHLETGLRLVKVSGTVERVADLEISSQNRILLCQNLKNEDNFYLSGISALNAQDLSFIGLSEVRRIVLSALPLANFYAYKTLGTLIDATVEGIENDYPGILRVSIKILKNTIDEETDSIKFSSTVPVIALFAIIQLLDKIGTKAPYAILKGVSEHVIKVLRKFAEHPLRALRRQAAAAQMTWLTIDEEVQVDQEDDDAYGDPGDEDD